MQSEPSLSFRRLKRSDLPILLRWVGEPHVARWYAAPRTLTGLEAKYGPRIEDREPTRPFLILLGEEPVGYIQTYRIADHPDYAERLALTEAAAGVDLYLGEPDLVHRGLGARVLRSFLSAVVFSDPDIESCVVGPDPANAAAIRCYENVGFRFIREVEIPGEAAPEHLMRLGRRDLDQ